jgi:hypothetical protein
MKIARWVAALLVMASASAYAQNSRWADPYRAGVKAFESGKYAEAIPLLERAAAVDSKSQAQKYVEGVFRVDYFPYYYLALAYAETKDWAKAKENLEKARPTLTRQQQAKFKDAEGIIARALAPTPDPRKAAFDAAVAQAESSLSDRKWQQAIGQFDALRSGYSAEYNGAGLSAKRDEAVKGYAGQLWDEGRQLLQQNKLNEAKAKLTLADQTLGGQKATTDLLADIKRREDDYQRLKSGAQNDTNQKNYSSARDKYQQAQTAHPELFAADNLSARLTEVIALGRGGGGRPGGGDPGGGGTPGGGGARGGGIVDPKVADGQRLALRAKELVAQGKYAEADTTYASALQSDPKNQDAVDAVNKATKFKALRDQSAKMARSKNVPGAQQALVEARTLDPERFTTEGLAAVLAKLTPTPENPARAALQSGLLALLKGRAAESIAILEPVSRSEKAASVHAYLGVAYATQALSAPKDEDRARLRSKAVEQFKLAKSAEPDYQLSTRIVSPAILSIYQESAR